MRFVVTFIFISFSGHNTMLILLKNLVAKLRFREKLLVITLTFTLTGHQTEDRKAVLFFLNFFHIVDIFMGLPVLCENSYYT